MTLYRCCDHCPFDCVGKYYGHTGRCTVEMCIEEQRSR